ncbi:NAD-dependent epimerase/dehydratase family protein [Pseudooctadecabacter jejudonensis]|uniref:UDP-glucose 4-epimerase n=1 Tax=Pseudooctadecabacter jejudonensis TaxID=1391910 RepID=A0A1Y5SDU3_9RHOB|nr:SDR family oxidoreductase [Pseudooctadecabacter jejudonensis]SLN35379.1 UDP-glucose 4-epimerase [Pseudooctadecabacter jejudonensis]
MATIVLGAQGKLGGSLIRHARRAQAGWVSQGRSAGADIVWSGDFDAAETGLIAAKDSTVINMIGSANGDTAALTAINVTFVESLLKHCASAGVAHVILASSVAVYGAGDGADFEESAALSPLTPYGISKARMEDVARGLTDTADCPAVTILRIGNVAGADALTRIAATHHGKGSPMTLHRYPDGSVPVRSYIGPADLFDVIRTLVPRPAEPLRILNIAAPTPVPLDRVLVAYRDHVFPDLKWDDAPTPTGVPPRVVLSTDALQRVVSLPWDADYPAEMAGQVAQDHAL